MGKIRNITWEMTPGIADDLQIELNFLEEENKTKVIFKDKF
jgi:hypothetical protein